MRPDDVPLMTCHESRYLALRHVLHALKYHLELSLVSISQLSRAWSYCGCTLVHVEGSLTWCHPGATLLNVASFEQNRSGEIDFVERCIHTVRVCRQAEILYHCVTHV